MFPDHLLPDYCDKPERQLRPDRRPLPQSNEIRIRVKRAAARLGS